MYINDMTQRAFNAKWIDSILESEENDWEDFIENSSLFVQYWLHL